MSKTMSVLHIITQTKKHSAVAKKIKPGSTTML